MISCSGFFCTSPPALVLPTSGLVRIHWAIVLLAVIGAISITWYARTKDMNFLQPEGIDLSADRENTNIATGTASVQPTLSGDPESQPPLPEEADRPVEPKVTPITEDDLGDLDAAPGLKSYQDFARHHPADRLFELSSALRAKGHFQRALLAIERVVDTCESDAKLLTEAGLGIAALTPTLPRWNVDPSAEIPLNLILSLARPAPDSLKKTLVDLALTIRESSGDQLEIIPVVKSSETPGASPDGPVALWFSPIDNDEVTSSVITTRLTANPEQAYSVLALALFKAIRSSLGRTGYPPAIELEVDGPDLLKTQMTRLMWRDFAHSLTTATRGTPETEEGNDENFYEEN